MNHRKEINFQDEICEPVEVSGLHHADGDHSRVRPLFPATFYPILRTGSFGWREIVPLEQFHASTQSIQNRTGITWGSTPVM